MERDNSNDEEGPNYDQGVLRLVDYTSDTFFGIGAGLALSASFGSPEMVGYVIAGTFTAACSGAVRGISGYMKWYYSPKNNDLRRRIEQEESVRNKNFRSGREKWY